MNFQTFRDLVLSLPDHAASHGEDDCLRLLGSALAELTEHRAHLSEADDKREMAEFRELLRPVLSESEFCDYVFRKPRGYPGDFVTQEMIWFGRTLGMEHRYIGTTPLGKLLSSLTLEMPNCRANEERIRRLTRRVRESGTRLASIGCGSCIELWEQSAMEAFDVLLLDQDRGALDRARQKVSPSIGKVTFLEHNILKFVLGNSKAESVGQRDFVYAFGLLDYFECQSARRITKGLWQMVAPGGCLLITNAHPNNLTRFWMEYGGDWFLKYKDETQMRELAEGLEGVASLSLTSDGQHVYQYLEIRRGNE